MDTAGAFDGLKPDKVDTKDTDESEKFSANTAAETRRKLFENEKSILLSGKLHCDILNVNRYLLNNVDVKLVLTKASPNFYLMGSEVAATSKIEITETYLKGRRVSISPTIM